MGPDRVHDFHWTIINMIFFAGESPLEYTINDFQTKFIWSIRIRNAVLDNFIANTFGHIGI